jgi:hypothetical protein
VDFQVNTDRLRTFLNALPVAGWTCRMPHSADDILD